MEEILGVLRRHQVVKGLTPEKLRLIFEDLGPTFVKFGQIMSMRSDMLPQAYCRELSGLRKDVRPMSREEAESVLKAEYGWPLSGTFSKFDWEPLGSASIAQVYRAELKDGEQVVVKVERPGIYEIMAEDVSLLRRVSGLIKIVGGMGDAIDFNLVIDEMWTAAQQEMDFRQEADQAEEFRRMNSNVAYVAVPRIYREYSTSRVLVMESMEGIPVDAVETLKAQGYDRTEIGMKLAENYVKQIVDDGFFHADPHPGNLRIRGGKIVWLDMGMMGRLTERDRRVLGEALSAAVCGDVNEVKDLLLVLGKHTGPVDHARLYTDLDEMLNKYETMDVGSMNMAEIRDDVLALANRHHISMPSGFTMLGRGLVTIEGVVSTVSPEINVLQIMANHVTGGFLQKFDLSGELKKDWYLLYRSGRRALNIPAQVSEFLKMGIKGQTKTNIEITGAEQPMRMMGKLVNRLALSVVEAGLLISSAILGASGLPKYFLGLPAWSVAGFCLSLFVGVLLLWNIIKDRP